MCWACIISYTIRHFFSVFCKKAFAAPSSGTWDIVVNCAAENRPNQSDAVYKEGIYKLSVNCANEAAQIGAKRYIELSSGNIASSEKTALAENCKTDPWTSLAKFKLKVEKELSSVPKLNYTVLRLPIVYGVGDTRWLSKFLVIYLYFGVFDYINEFFSTSYYHFRLVQIFGGNNETFMERKHEVEYCPRRRRCSCCVGVGTKSKS